MKAFDIKTAFEKLDIKPVNLDNFKTEPEIIKFNPDMIENLRYGDVLIFEDHRNYEFAWMLLSNAEAEKHRNEFLRNKSLLREIDSGKDVFVMPETSQNIFGFFYRSTCDLEKDHFKHDDRVIKYIIRLPGNPFVRCENIMDIFRKYNYFKEYR